MHRYRLLLLISLLLFLSCERKQEVRHEEQPPVTTPQVQELLKTHTSSWMQIPGVIGAGEGRRNNLPCVLVYVVKETGEIASRLPDSVGGFAVFMKEVGERSVADTR